MPARRGRRCPICGRAATDLHRPFCSRRCADIDLNRWLSGGYVIPASEDTPARDAEGSDQHGDDERH